MSEITDKARVQFLGFRVNGSLEPVARIEEEAYCWYLPGVGEKFFDSLEEATKDAPIGAFLMEVAAFQKVLGRRIG